MSSYKQIIRNWLAVNDHTVQPRHEILLERFSMEPDIVSATDRILQLQASIMNQWLIESKVSDILSRIVSLPNATAGKHYHAHLNLASLGLSTNDQKLLDGLEPLQLSFEPETGGISGIPSTPGEHELMLRFKVEGEGEHTTWHEKRIFLYVNPDPKTLWQNQPSDQNGFFAKPDDVTEFSTLGDRHIVVSSKRGRSHANVGSYRDDDYAFRHFESTGWSVVAVSDGAGSYPFSRKGSELACKSVIDFFADNQHSERSLEMEAKLQAYETNKDDGAIRAFKTAAIQYMYQATRHVHNTLRSFAEAISTQYPDRFTNPRAKTVMDYFHATLIFVAFKKCASGYVVMSFGVGDCPIAMVSADTTEATLLNWLDIGEYGGGTRFVTQPEIFQKQEVMGTRFGVRFVPDFSYLFLMTDGIYDPKFVVEANLEKTEKWMEFIADLHGNNEDRAQVELNPGNHELTAQLSNWMDFWSPGNHDDRTLAIIF